MDHDDPRWHGTSSPRFVVGVSVVIMTVSVVIDAVLFVGLMMTYRASDSGTRHDVMVRQTAHNPANHRSFDASSSKGRRRGRPRQDKHSAENQDTFHYALPYQGSVNACESGAFHPAQFRLK
jgi:hypothetical protein